VVGTLRTARPDGQRSPGAETIGPLVAEFQAAGVPVTMREDGTPRPLGPAGHAAYRVVEEGLTNAVKHAPGQPVTVRLRWEPDALLLTLDNPLPGGAASHTRPPGHPRPDTAGPSGRTDSTRRTRWPVGHGLAGLRERVDEAGGLVEHRVSEQGWRLFAMLPAAENAERDGDGDGETIGADDRSAAVGVRTLAVGFATAALMFVALPASMLLGIR
jgi:signal transduction histidine kinase